MTQRTFIKAYNAIGRFRPDARFAPWILKIANRELLDHLKKRKRLRRKRLDTIPLEPTPDFSMPRRQVAARPHISLPSDPATFPDPDEQRRMLEGAIDQLKGRVRRCMYLREIEGLSYEHIAEKMRIPKGSVSTLLNRGRKQVKEILAEQNPPK